MAKKPEGNGFAELLRYSHMVAPEVMGLKDGGLLGGFWLAGPDLESSTARELEHLGSMISHTIAQLDVRWCIHFEFFRREVREYPSGDFTETTTKLIDLERDLQFHKESGHYTVHETEAEARRGTDRKRVGTGKWQFIGMWQCHFGRTPRSWMILPRKSGTYICIFSRILIPTFADAMR